MSSSIYADLFWLPKSPENFSSLCRSVLEDDHGLGRRLQGLAKYALNGNQLGRLAKVLAKARADGMSLAPLTPFRLGVLSNSTLDFIVPALEATALRHGIALECIKADYGQVIQAALSPDSVINRAMPDAVLVAVDLRYLPLQSTLGNQEAAAAAVSGVLQHFQAIREGVRNNSGAISILQTLAPLPESLFGSFDRVLPGAPRQLIDAVNRGLAESVYGTEDVLVDVSAIAETVGLAQWHSPAQWNMAKLPFADELVPLYADYVARTIAALRGKSRRCLVLDLDNTVWGGVIGDDGLEGIKVAQGDAAGEAHLAVQRMALALRERGVVLAVSSKNNDDVARKPFREHPEMLLKEDHIAVFQANWNDKATNIKAIAEELSLGLESFVFLDDNPVERGLVREILPQVAIPELPDDPALFSRTLSAAGYFEAVTFSSEDLKRADYYQDNARRVTLQNQAGDIDAYLASLKMEITFQPFDRTGRSRIAQLINKSNQYNLTTHRYTEAEVAAAETDPRCFTLQVRLADIFGDNGMISVVICRRTDPKVWEIDTWLMSCRVLGRKVQEAVLREILKHAEGNGIEELIGIYKPTDRNQMVEGHYRSLGFEQIGSEPDGSTTWKLLVQEASVVETAMLVRSTGFETVEIGNI
ncbi:HAD-IIIC family phosphatase [Tunturibacter empetritectus]|uniref:FkbH-like protein n=2 Tax=Tunturiibacter empetritectus TaxID=3069691 RepID=A0A7W8IFV8_9BACT|nr:HAD-IIIC family phosphatase [Edaphobacter lichenicola]MBB5315606.1 FkbH-like protein [Edaphobacter lichenicola]